MPFGLTDWPGFTFERNIYGYGWQQAATLFLPTTAGIVFATVYASGWNIGGDATSQAVDPVIRRCNRPGCYG